ncbi:hypothetical protein KM043_013545 [Ampulex compressa]|nr:hypothetical protein KM043_013545 [Ampulex compressa]
MRDENYICPNDISEAFSAALRRSLIRKAPHSIVISVREELTYERAAWAKITDPTETVWRSPDTIFGYPEWPIHLFGFAPVDRSPSSLADASRVLVASKVKDAPGDRKERESRSVTLDPRG